MAFAGRPAEVSICVLGLIAEPVAVAVRLEKSRNVEVPVLLGELLCTAWRYIAVVEVARRTNRAADLYP